jgi:steroid Delta-isomerase
MMGAMSAPVARIVDAFETLTPATLPALAALYADGARFADPFNDVTGVPAIRAVFAHMFATLDAPRFEVLESVSEGDRCVLVWNFHFRRRGHAADLMIHGASHLRFGADGRVTLHRDYWDAAQQVYEAVPVLGAVLRWLRRRLGAGPASPAATGVSRQ